LDALQQ